MVYVLFQHKVALKLTGPKHAPTSFDRNVTFPFGAISPTNVLENPLLIFSWNILFSELKSRALRRQRVVKLKQQRSIIFYLFIADVQNVSDTC